MGRTFFICIGLLIRLLVDRSSSPVTPDCGQPCSTKTRSKENTNAPKVAKPLNQPSFPPRSGFVQQADRANDEERSDAAVPIGFHGRAPRQGSSVALANMNTQPDPPVIP